MHCRRLLTLALVAATLAAPTTATADGVYFSESLGGSSVEGEMSRFFGSGFTFRLALGYHASGIAAEGSIALHELPGKSLFGDAYYTAAVPSIQVRRLFPLSEHTRAYLRGGLGKMYVSGFGRGDGYSGKTLDYGAGVMVSGRVPALGFLFSPLFFCDCGPKVSAGGWLDVGQVAVQLKKRGASTLDGRLSSVTVGFSLGGSF